MQNKKELITDQDDIFFFFEMIKNIAPQSMLDVGAFLKRIAAVSRQAMSYEIPKDVVLCGIDYFPEKELKVYEQIYDRIINAREFFQYTVKEVKREYDVAVILKSEGQISNEEEEYLWHFVLSAAAGVMTEEDTAKRQVEAGKIKGYYFVSAGGGRYAWIPVDELRGDI